MLFHANPQTLYKRLAPNAMALQAVKNFIESGTLALKFKAHTPEPWTTDHTPTTAATALPLAPFGIPYF